MTSPSGTSSSDGEQIVDGDARVSEIVDRHGFVHARLSWAHGALVELEVPGAIVRGALVEDPLLGQAHEIVSPAPSSSAESRSPDSPSSSAESRSPAPRPTSAKSNELVLTTISALDWTRPTEIPAIAAPGKLPPGVGGAIMNVLAILAHRAGVTELRYAGPYPTNALFSTLARSFRTTTSEEEFTSTFGDRASRLARDPMDAVFVPAPHDRVAIVVDEDVAGVVEIRDGIERATLHGVMYARGGGITRLDNARAEVWFADELYAHVATFAADGELLEGPHPIPACESDVIGKAFPPEMVAALAELVAELVTPALAKAATHVVAGRTLRWADLGARPAARVGDELQLHAALWRLAPRGMARLAMALVEALVPIVGPLAASTMIASR